MYVFARWKHTRQGWHPAVPRGWGFLLLAECGRGDGRPSEWCLLSISKDSISRTKGLVKVDPMLRALLDSALRYPPAMALTRRDLERTGNPQWGPSAMGARLARLLRHHLRAQPRAPGVLLEARSTETGYLESGEFVWALEHLIDPCSRRAVVRWVSSDFFVYTNLARDFRLTPELRSQLEQRSQTSRFVRAVKDGLADADAGRIKPHAEVVRAMKARFSQGKRNRTQ
ncbi:MAG TPA: hypothetical protein VGK67_02625 [Myxococcales bacterium]|jgi:hypothetical protein